MGALSFLLPLALAAPHQQWFGTAPWCSTDESDCTSRGMKFVKYDERGDGDKCWSGNKVLCELDPAGPQQQWFGTAPACSTDESDCTSRGMKFVKYHKSGDGKLCWSGRKVLCELPTQGYKWIGTAPNCMGVISDCAANNMAFVLKHNAGDGKNCLTGTKVLCKPIPPVIATCANDKATQFNVVVWNIFSRPFIASHDGQYERQAYIPDFVAGMADGCVDTIIFVEAFIMKPDFLMKLNIAGYKYHTAHWVTGEDGDMKLFEGKLTNGGCFIASKWPIYRSEYLHYSNDALGGDDQMARKGIGYAKITKSHGGHSKTYHVAGTHAQASYKSKDISEWEKLRMTGAREASQFLGGLGIPPNEPLIIGGDLNSDDHRRTDETKKLMEETMDAVEPKAVPGSTLYSGDPFLNPLVGTDGEAKDEGCLDTQSEMKLINGKCGFSSPASLAASPSPTTSPSSLSNPASPRHRYCQCCAQSHYDYVLYSQKYAIPTTSSSEIVPAQAPQFFPACMGSSAPGFVDANGAFCRTRWTLKDLSDHYPIIGRFDYSPLASPGCEKTYNSLCTQINFQPESTVATVPAGWLKDTGAAYAERGNGQSYGWSCDLSADTRERGVSSDPLFDTFMILDRKEICASTYWEIALAPGTYLVKIGFGDPSYGGSSSGCTVGPSGGTMQPVSGSRIDKEMTVSTQSMTIGAGQSLRFAGEWSSDCSTVNTITITRSTYASDAQATGKDEI